MGRAGTPARTGVFMVLDGGQATVKGCSEPGCLGGVRLQAQNQALQAQIRLHA